MAAYGIPRVLFLLVTGFATYYAWDGFVERRLSQQQIDGRAAIVTAGWVNIALYPLDKAENYLQVDVHNNSSKLITGITLSGRMLDKNNNVLASFSNVPCLKGLKSTLSIDRAATPACVGSLPKDVILALQNPEYDRLQWRFDTIYGRSKPPKVLHTIAEYLKPID